ncbi:hypothetical protein [Nocardia veterana]|uniref:Uncharacterized protein n=1 Tax=Nocardia veterana TaxID=132249 RepID=A0A7X6RJS4_9NOCA|nr:hypothetical protein [Nocardia veterana]NKY88491.1 hypothetical protein [Nocardia veterana]
MSFTAFLTDSARRVRARYHLTPEERHNLRLAHLPPAVVSASLGAHPRHR